MSGIEWKEEWERGNKKRNKTIADEFRDSHKKHFEEEREKKDTKVLEIIKAYHSKGGIFQTKIAQIMKETPRTVRKSTTRLEKKGFVTKTKMGYILTQDPFKEPMSNAELFAYRFMSTLKRNIKNTEFLVLNNENNYNLINAIKNTKYTFDFTTYKNFFEPKFKEKSIEKQLFEFSNMIGSFIVYLLIYSINPQNHNKTAQSEIEIENLRQGIVKVGFVSIIPSLMNVFIDLLNTVLTTKYKKYGQNNNNSYILENKDVEKLIEAFTNIYPMVSFEFENWLPARYMFKTYLRGLFPIIIQNHKEYLEKYHEEYEKQREKR